MDPDGNLPDGTIPPTRKGVTVHLNQFPSKKEYNRAYDGERKLNPDYPLRMALKGRKQRERRREKREKRLALLPSERRTDTAQPHFPASAESSSAPQSSASPAQQHGFAQYSARPATFTDKP